MSASQFTIYRSSDASAPTLTGAASSLLGVLDACLVNGYTGKAAAGWSKPFANSGNIGCYKNSASGTNLSLSVNDNGPGVGTFKEARVTGYESLSSVSAGSGPFPSTAQGVASAGYVVVRKSTTADGTTRTWLMLADAYTFYFFAVTGDNIVATGQYYPFGFGDIFSLKSSTDSYRCGIWGRISENVSSTGDSLPALAALTAANSGEFMARSYGGGGTSISISKHGDSTKGSAAGMFGTMQYPNGPDNSMYMSPVWVAETATSTVRGRMRGLFQICHATTSFADGDTFSGAGDFAGKTFLIIKPVVSVTSAAVQHMCVETSATVETN